MKPRTTLPARRPRRSAVKPSARHSRASASSGLSVDNLRPGLERDTQVMPWIIADTVCGEVSRFLGVEIPARYSDWLDAKAERCYARHDHFRKLMRGRGNAPRDWLYAFMRHWLAAMLDLERPDLYQCLPEDFNLGHRLPTGQHPLIRRKGFVPTLLPKSRPWNARRVICVIPLFPILAGVHIRCGRRVGNHNRPKGHGGLIRFPDRTQPVGSRT